MPLHIIRNDITKMNTDAIVNAANPTLLGGGGVDGAIHAAAGPGLLNECRKLNGCRPGEAKLTKGYRLPAKYVIHTVGPVYRDGRSNEETILRAAYRNSLLIAEAHQLKSIAFPLISAGVYGYPKAEAFRTAVSEISGFLFIHEEMDVYLVLFDRGAYDLGRSFFPDLESYISDRYAVEKEEAPEEQRRRKSQLFFGKAAAAKSDSADASSFRIDNGMPCHANAVYPNAVPLDMNEKDSLDDLIRKMDAGFTETLLKKIDERGMTDAECYKRANIDRKLFSKIRKDPDYRPKKKTVVAFAIALKLTLSDTEDLLKKAGYALSDASLFDVIIRYCITHGIYDIYDVNMLLFEYDQAQLGAD